MRHEILGPDGSPVVLDDGVLDTSELTEFPELPRRCYAAAHLVMLPGYADVDHSSAAPGTPEEIAASVDWETTMELRRRIDGLGMGIAEAMDTAQRFEIGWRGARELMERTGALRLENGFVGAASSDHRAAIESVEELASAIAEQVEFVATNGGLPIVLPQLWMTERGMAEADYVQLYRRVIELARTPLLIHWLGEVFHAGMRGYFPGSSIDEILALDPSMIRGLKLSLLDSEYEEVLRERMTPRGQVVLTGDDYHFAKLMEGRSQEALPLAPLGNRPISGGDFSHALLGILDGIAAPASVALQRLGRGDLEGYRALMGPCEELGRAIFEAPVASYKAGLALLSWLNGHQENPMLPNHLERERSPEHYARVAGLASRAGALEDAGLAAERLGALLSRTSASGTDS